MVPGTTSADHGPIWSADGTTLGFVRFEDGAERVGYVHPDGSWLQIVPDTDVMNVQQAFNDPTEIGWASDSRLLGYISATDSRLHVVDTTDRSDRAVSPPGVYVDSLSWRPGSPQVVSRALVDQHRRLAVLGIDGSVRTIGDYARHAFELVDPSWSADGSRIAYPIEASDGVKYQVHTINPDGTDDRVISGSVSAWDAVWSPTDAMLVFLGQRPSGGYRLYTAATSGLGEPVAISPRFDIGNFGWSPDGRSVIAQLDTDPTVWLFDPTGASPPRKAPYSAGPESWPAWQRVAG
jgi:dipeptidyl aminopeptidase/acylaminoacyl peptidase